MFQPTNESFIRSTVEATLDRHIDANDEECALREGKSYQPNGLVSQSLRLLHAIGHSLLSAGKRLDEIGTPNAPMTQRQSIVR